MKSLFEERCESPTAFKNKQKFKFVGDVITTCTGLACTFSCANPNDELSSPVETVKCANKKGWRIFPGLCGFKKKPCVIECGAPKDTKCGNFPTLKGATVTQQCQELKKKKLILQQCKVQCNDARMVPTVPAVTCNLNKKMFMPIKGFACKLKPETNCGNTADHFVVKGGKIGKCNDDGRSAALKAAAVHTSTCAVTCDDPKHKPSVLDIKCNLMKSKKKLIPKWAPMPPRFNKMEIICAAPAAAPDADKTVVSGGSGGGNKCGNPLDKRNKMIKKAKIKVDPRSVNVQSCDSTGCNLKCKPGLVWDRMSKGAVNGIIRVSLK